MAQPQVAHAIVMDRYGGPEVLTWRAGGLAPLTPGLVRIRTRLAAVNHTDLKIRAGIWPIRSAKPFPYTPGVELVGDIVELADGVMDLEIGQTVITMMQGLGGVRAEHPGAYAEFVSVSASAVCPLPPDLDLASVAALGLAGVTAFEGLGRLGPLTGRRLLVTGAAGGVGSAAVAIGKVLGAEVHGLVTRQNQVDRVLAQGARRAIVVDRGGPAMLGVKQYDGIFDTVGGAGFAPCVQALVDGGTLCLVGAVGGGDVAFDAWDLIRPVVLTGYSTETLDGVALARAVAALCAGLQAGVLSPPPYEILPLRQAQTAHRRLEAGGQVGRILLSAE
ncbi:MULTISPECIES: quinone oxidoreductase family protein [Caulobacter]|nr:MULTISPECIES: zinc-binding alcohol dehydrogenase family protein [Caulobacter]